MEVVEYVKEKNQNKMPGKETRRLFARPNVLEWLSDLIELDTSNRARAVLWQELVEMIPIDSPNEEYEFTDRVLYEPHWLHGHAKAYEDDPDKATHTLLEAFDSVFCDNIENNVAVNQYFFHSSPLVSDIISEVVIFTVALPRIISTSFSPAVRFELAFFK